MFVKGTLKITSILLILAIILLLFRYTLISFIIFLIIAFLLQFFRDPSRKTPEDEGVIVASADGRFLNGKIDIIKIVESEDHLTRQVLEKHEKGILISTYMSGLDVHVNRVPITGRIIKTQYYPGKFKLAQGDVHKENEKNLIVIESKYGKIGVVQIAGFVARRIVQYVQMGDIVHTGDRLGMIRFGSRVDVIIPYKNSQLMIYKGGRPKAGETIIARMTDKDTKKINHE
jgi:phosphatidylserine decarboxylase